MSLWILAIESVATAGSVALLRDETLVGEIALPPASRSARTLASAVQDLWKGAGKPSISLVAVARGPGSFTGLRVGITTAKSLAFAWQAKLLSVNTLDAIAAQCQPVDTAGDTYLEVVLDAQRQEVFVARFRPSPEGGEDRATPWERLADDTILPNPQWLAQLTPQIQVAGPALARLRNRLPEGIPVAPEFAWHPRAATIGKLAASSHHQGAADELWNLVPHYGRPSYAEEKATPRPDS